MVWVVALASKSSTFRFTVHLGIVGFVASWASNSLVVALGHRGLCGTWASDGGFVASYSRRCHGCSVIGLTSNLGRRPNPLNFRGLSFFIIKLFEVFAAICRIALPLSGFLHSWPL